VQGSQISERPAELQTRLSTIDQWRGISVLMVIVHHFADFRYRQLFDVAYRLSDFTRNPTFSNLSVAGRRVFYLWSHNIGPLGVQIFFAISGYIITRLLLKEHRNTGTVCFACFYIRRAFRILPALVLFVLITGLISYCGFITISPAEIGSVATFLCNTTLVNCGYHYGHLWSLCIEEQFYILWPLAFVFVIGGRRTAIVWVIFAVCMSISVIPHLWVAGWINNGLSFGCIAAGAAYALSERFRSLFSFAAKWPGWLLTVTLLVGLPLFKSFALNLWALSTIMTPLVIVAVVLTRADSPFVRDRTGISRFLNQVGRMSYSLYLWHVIFIWEPERYHSSRFLLASLPLGVMLAWLSANYVEPFFISRGRRFADRVERHAAPSVVDA
jgi:peptidoglycan/LPS O-acetylase OafA/YrhL